MQDKGQATKRHLARPQRRAKPAVKPSVKKKGRRLKMKNSENQGSKTKNKAVKPAVEPNKVGSNKKKFALYIDPELLEKVDDLYEEQNCGSRSEFINRAIRNYIGQVVSDKHVGYLAPLIQEMVDASVNLSEMRMSRNLFKIAVELGKLTHLVAAMNEVDDDTVRDLHYMVVDEVRRINGVINYERADRFQHDD